jgi:ribosomal protein RSM22 (predicted rRNA methylase)
MQKKLSQARRTQNYVRYSAIMKIRHLHHFTLPESITERIQWGLDREQFNLEQKHSLSEAILDLSRQYLDRTIDPQLWTNRRHRAAYWAYFLPLNFLRLTAVLEEGLRLNFFKNIKEVVDFGSGPGTGLLAWDLLQVPVPLDSYKSIDSAREPLEIMKAMIDKFPVTMQTEIHQSRTLPRAPHSQSLALLSYSLNEGHSIPENLDSYSHVLILEPSSRAQGRQLMVWRNELLDKGYHIWAPCTHQMACPLLEMSKSDWCHDRILLRRPDWLIHLEDLLPLDNRSLTFSYLMASRIAPPEWSVARIIGDTLEEKGKTKQALCRSPKREFLSWLKKEGRAPLIPRGSRVELPTDLTIKANELRSKSEIKIHSTHGKI